VNPVALAFGVGDELAFATVEQTVAGIAQANPTGLDILHGFSNCHLPFE
jgi:hypothetical protein